MKPKHLRAIGISYQSGSDNAPTISLKAESLDADFIIKTALRFGIPIIERQSMARLLEAVPLDAEIPASLFEAVATIINELEN